MGVEEDADCKVGDDEEEAPKPTYLFGVRGLAIRCGLWASGLERKVSGISKIFGAQD